MTSPITQRIVAAQERLVELKDQLTAHLASYDENSVTDEKQTVTDELNAKIETTEKSYQSLQIAEKRLAATAEPAANGGGNGGIVVHHARPFAQVAQKSSGLDLILRAVAIKAKAHVTKEPPIEVLRQNFGEDEPTKIIFDMISKSAVIPADTVTTNWATQLCQTVTGEFFNALIAYSVYPRLAGLGMKFSFGRNQTVVLPTRNAGTPVSGSFVAQGAAIPVRQGAFASVSFTPKKMGVITTMTRDISEHSIPAIQDLLRQAMFEDTGIALDTVLLGAGAADTTTPAGLRNGVSATTVSTFTTITGLVADLKALAGVLITGTNGNIRSPVWIMNPADILAARLQPATAGGGEFPFADELIAGTLLGYPVIASSNQTADIMTLLDAADFVSVTGDTPRFDVSDQAVLHMETSPTAISTTTTAVAAPVRSLWQTDTMAIRLLWDVNWGMRRTGVVAWASSMNWN